MPVVPAARVPAARRRSRMSLLNTVKYVSLDYGGYRTLRWLQDSVISRSRRDEFRNRVKFYRTLVERDDLCFDIGSNIGDISAVLLHLGARVVAIDPQAAAMKELRARLGHYPKLRCLEVGLARAPGEMTLYLHDAVGTTSMLQNWTPGTPTGSVQVPVTTLEHLISQFGVPKYCKIDVEGFEYEVLMGLGRKLDLLSFEFHADDDNLKLCFECLKLLERHGPITANIVPFGHYTFAWTNWKSRDEVEAAFVEGGLSRDPAFAYGDIFVRW